MKDNQKTNNLGNVADIRVKPAETKQKADPDEIRPQFQFIPRLRGKKVTLRLLPNHAPVTGTLVAHNPYEIVLENRTQRGVKQIIYYKHSVVSIEPEEPVRW